MMRISRWIGTGGLLVAALSCSNGQPARTVAASDPLPGWNEGPAKQAITDFVARGH